MANEKKVPAMQDADLKGKVVLVRMDHNVVKGGQIHDTFRIDQTVGTLFNIFVKGGKPIIMTHVGRPKDKKTGKIETAEKTSVKPIIEYLSDKLNLKIGYPELQADGEDGIKDLSAAKNWVEKLKNGEYDALYLPNTRWFYGEERKDEGAEKFAKDLATLADVYLNDAFGSWQPHATTATIAENLPSYAGILMQKELHNLDRIFNPVKPLVAVVAGSKFDTKIASLTALLEKADYLILGGVIYNAYLCAKYGFEIKGIEEEDVKVALEFVQISEEKFPGKLIELPYIIESDILDGKIEGQYRTHDIRMMEKGAKLSFVLDADPKSFEDPKVKDVFMNGKTFFVNAVMGLAPHFNDGTIAMDKLIDSNVEANKLFGGGDTLQEMKRLVPDVYLKAVDNPKYYLFTGGGAVLKAIQEGEYTGLGPIKALLK